jgi:hypothetical protein
MFTVQLHSCTVLERLSMEIMWLAWQPSRRCHPQGRVLNSVKGLKGSTQSRVWHKGGNPGPTGRFRSFAAIPARFTYEQQREHSRELDALLIEVFSWYMPLVRVANWLSLSGSVGEGSMCVEGHTLGVSTHTWNAPNLELSIRQNAKR